MGPVGQCLGERTRTYALQLNRREGGTHPTARPLIPVRTRQLVKRPSRTGRAALLFLARENKRRLAGESRGRVHEGGDRGRAGTWRWQRWWRWQALALALALDAEGCAISRGEGAACTARQAKRYIACERPRRAKGGLCSAEIVESMWSTCTRRPHHTHWAPAWAANVLRQL